MMSHTCNPSHEKLRQENPRIKANLRYPNETVLKTKLTKNETFKSTQARAVEGVSLNECACKDQQ